MGTHIAVFQHDLVYIHSYSPYLPCKIIKIVDFCRVSTIDFQGMAKLKQVAKDYEYLLLTEVDETIYQSLEKSQVF